MKVEQKYKVILVTEEPFRIGGPKDPLSGADNPVAIVGSKLVVPGPSLKGAYRAEIERFLIDRYYDKINKRWVQEKESLMPCIPATKLSKDEEKLVKNRLYRSVACHYPCDKRRDKCGNTEHSICPACYLLGSQGLNGFLRVPFLFSEASASELYSARIDRAVSTVAQGTNRPYSLVPDGTTFEGTLTVLIKDDILGWELGKPRPLSDISGKDIWLPSQEWTQERILSEMIVQRLQNIKILGGYKSKGCGKVKITIKEV